MDDNMMERQIADYMVEYGTKNTDSGMWGLKLMSWYPYLAFQRNGFRSTMMELYLNYI